MFDEQRLYDIESEVFNRIQGIKKEREQETKAFIDGMEKGSDLMFKAIREELKRSDNNE